MDVKAPATKVEDLVRDAMPPDLTKHERQSWIDEATACFRRNGVIVIRHAIPSTVVAAVFDDYKVRHDVHMAPGQRKLFRAFTTDPLRAQIPIAIDGPAANPEFFAPPSVLAVVRELMADDLIVGEMGLVISHTGAGPQETHRDSLFLFGGLDNEIDLPPFAIAMLAPLVDVTLDMGPTEFWPGSHRLRDQAAATAVPSQRTELKAGTIVLVDARTLHRGGAHKSGPVRPCVYFSFHRSWFQENAGYEHKPQVRVTPAMLQRLPEAYRPLFSWALHLNRTDGFQDFVYRWIGRIRRRLV
jgi:Phytanoyl-CoA dioxygenase (PhyH)